MAGGYARGSGGRRGPVQSSIQVSHHHCHTHVINGRVGVRRKPPRWYVLCLHLRVPSYAPAFPHAPPRLLRARRASSFVSNVLRRSSSLNHLSPLPSPEASPSRRTPRSTTLAAYWEAESRGTVQVPAPESAAPQACAAQATVRSRLPARQQRRDRRGPTRQAEVTRSRLGLSPAAAPT